MEADISHVRRNILLLLVTIVVVFAVLLLAATPVISNLSPEGTRQERVNYLIGLPMVVSILGGLLHIYLRPIARLATLIKDEEKLPPDLAQRARTLAFALPVWTLYIPPAVTLAIGTAVAFASTLASQGLIKLVERDRALWPYAAYRLGLAAVVLRRRLRLNQVDE